MIRVLAALLLLSAAAAQADELVTAIPLPASALVPVEGISKLPISFSTAPRTKVVFSDSTSEVGVAMCGVEAYRDHADLDAGLIDYNVADPARSAGGLTDESKVQGGNARDFRTSVVLGVTLGYHF